MKCKYGNVLMNNVYDYADINGEEVCWVKRNFKKVDRRVVSNGKIIEII